MKRKNGVGVGPDWIGLAASGVTLACCNGTLAMVIALSAAGIALDLDESIWAAAIVLLTLVAVAAVALGLQRHANVGPTVLAVAGFSLIVWTLLGDYRLMVEIFGFATLVAAAGWDWRLRRASA
jgi:hypothetical protein